MNPPLWGIFGGLILSIPPFGYTLFNRSSNQAITFINFLPWELKILVFFAQSIIEIIFLIGGINVVLQGLIIGSTLFSGLYKKNLIFMQNPVERETFLAVVFVRGFFVPLCTLGLVIIFSKLGIIPDDPVCSLFLLVQGAMPTAHNLVMLTQIKKFTKDYGPLVAQIIVLQYLCAFIFVTFWIIVFLVFTQLELL